MEKEFVPYKEVFDLILLGFNKPCFAYWTSDTSDETKEWELRQFKYKDFETCTREKTGQFTAPLYQQAFDWIRENYNKGHFIKLDNIEKKIYRGWIDKATERDAFEWVSDGDYYEVRLACLKKLIELVKEIEGYE